LSVTAYRLSTSEGTALPNVRVASFTELNLANALGCHTVTINWGDNTASTGTLTVTGATTADVFASHTYAEQGNYLVTVTVATESGTASAAGYSTASVTDLPVVVGTGTTLSAAGVGWRWNDPNWWSHSWWYNSGWYGNPWWWGGGNRHPIECRLPTIGRAKESKGK
jgi:hypothetical protein